jgi:cell division protease FtsH
MRAEAEKMAEERTKQLEAQQQETKELEAKDSEEPKDTEASKEA